jgi:hypothetical protein
MPFACCQLAGRAIAVQRGADFAFDCFRRADAGISILCARRSGLRARPRICRERCGLTIRAETELKVNDLRSSAAGSARAPSAAASGCAQPNSGGARARRSVAPIPEWNALVDKALGLIARCYAAQPKKPSPLTVRDVGNDEIFEVGVVDENKALCYDQSVKTSASVAMGVYSSGESRGT